MIHQLYPESLSGPAEYDYTRPVECFQCGGEYDREGHEDQLFDLEGVPRVYNAVICEDCDIRCAWCEWTVLEKLPCRMKQVENGVVWIDGEPYHGDCVAVALCQEAA